MPFRLDKRRAARMVTTLPGLAFLACASGEIEATPQDTVSQSAVRAMAAWNTIALRTTLAAPLSPPRETRAMAMLSIAVFDAVTSISGRYEPFGSRVAAEPTASAEAAVSAAAHHVLAALYPSADAPLDAAYDSALARIPAGPSKGAGIAAGEAAARAVLAMRERDRSSDRPSYNGRSGVGAWVPTPPAFAPAMEAGWGKVAPFVMDSGSQFRPADPPRLGSPAYVRDYAEVETLGAATSATRTASQTETAQFWMGTAAQIWNQLVRQLTIDRRMDVTSAARAYLLLNVAGADAIIAAWDAKYAYGQWRPMNAIRSLADDGSASTHADTAWVPLLATPPFPDYPAGHTSYGGAAEHVLTALFGDTPGGLTLTSPTAVGVTHHYGSFHEIAEEVVNARVWAGVHWRTSCTAGRELGQKVGARVLTRAPRQRGSP